MFIQKGDALRRLKAVVERHFRESDNLFNLPNKALLTKSQKDVKQEKLKAQKVKEELNKKREAEKIEKLKKHFKEKKG